MTARWILAPMLIAAIAPAAAVARVDHRGSVQVCRGGWVEHGPADRPIAPAYRGDTFVIERPSYAIVHHSDGHLERFAKGKLVHPHLHSSKPQVYRGWISVEALHCA